MLFGLEQDKRRQRLRSKTLETFRDKSSLDSDSFDVMVPGFTEARRKMSEESLELEEGESVVFEEE